MELYDVFEVGAPIALTVFVVFLILGIGILVMDEVGEVWEFCANKTGEHYFPGKTLNYDHEFINCTYLNSVESVIA
jgi:hypothetical protein